MAPRRHVGIPIITLGLAAWIVAVLAGAALVDPQAASRVCQWVRGIYGVAVASISSANQRVDAAAPTSPGAAEPELPVSRTEGQGGGSSGEEDLVVQEQSVGSAAPRPSAPAPKTCEGAIRAYRESVMAGDGGPPRPVREGTYAALLHNGVYLRECDVGDELGVDVCATIQHGKIVGVTVQTTPHRPRIERCLDRAVRALEVGESSPDLDVSRAHFEPRWR